MIDLLSTFAGDPFRPDPSAMRQALALARQNAGINNVRLRQVQSDLFPWLRDMIAQGQRWDVVVLDPAKLTRDREEVDLALRKYSKGMLQRIGLAQALLNEPDLIFLDEPTSGLDPATETQMMRLMRRLADEGATVLSTTHATKNLMMSDKVVFLARGGYLAFAGSPRRSLQYFGAHDFDEIYELLEMDSSPPEWAKRFQASPDFAAMLAGQMQPAEGDTSSASRIPHRTRRLPPIGRPTHQFRQFAVLAHRGLDMMVQSPANLFALFGQPIVISLLLLALFNSGSFSPGTLNPAAAVEMLLVICFAMFFFGVSFGLNEICQEWVILCRERMVHLGIGPYVLSKVAVLIPFLLLVETLVLVMLRFTARLPADGWDVYVALFLTLALTAAAGLAIGLFASSLVPDPDTATRILPVVLLPQALFSGGFVGRPAMGAVGQWLSTVTVLRWSFEGAGRNLHVNGLVPHTVSLAVNPLQRQYGDVFSRDPWQNWVILGAFVAISLILACFTLARRTAR